MKVNLILRYVFPPSIFRWSSDEPTVLEDINITVKKGSLTAIVGTVGSGKSSLVSAMLGEMEKQSGNFYSFEMFV